MKPAPLSDRIEAIKQIEIDRFSRSLTDEFNGWYGKYHQAADVLPEISEHLSGQILLKVDRSAEFIILDEAKIPFISLSDINDKLNNSTIERCNVEPSLQAFAGTIESGNKVFSFHDKNGSTYLVKCRLDENTNNLLPPL